MIALTIVTTYPISRNHPHQVIGLPQRGSGSDTLSTVYISGRDGPATNVRLAAISSVARPGGVHDHGDADQADPGPDVVPAVGVELVDDDAPGQGAGDEDPAVGRED